MLSRLGTKHKVKVRWGKAPKLPRSALRRIRRGTAALGDPGHGTRIEYLALSERSHVPRCGERQQKVRLFWTFCIFLKFILSK
jgi:hypothetical protein